ncbi:DUF805 domain-containing protein [Streptomyces sp. 4F14]|uniref:DUF805 domain-containing protein n=1 Tax=Streptomyces sp. 4F14 TaxID=3394380 RepID=UPI003A88B055
MSFTEAVRMSLVAKYATFSGRARRAEYWWYSVLYLMATIASVGAGWAAGIPLLSALVLPFVVPMLAVSVRRLHDTGRSGRRMFIALIPVAGPILYLAGMTVNSDPGDNRYGPSPKAVARPAG